TSDCLSEGTINDVMFGRRSMPHGKTARLDCRSCDDLEIVFWSEVADFELSKADNTECRGLHATNTNHAVHTVPQQRLGGGSGQREVEYLVGLLTGDSGLI